MYFISLFFSMFLCLSTKCIIHKPGVNYIETFNQLAQQHWVPNNTFKSKV